MTYEHTTNAVDANYDAKFLPKEADDQLPCLVVAGVQVYAYVNPDDGYLRVSVHLDEAEPWLIDEDGTVPMEVVVQGQPIHRTPRPQDDE